MFGKGLPKVSTDEKKIDELLGRGVEEILPSAESLKKLLLSGRRLRIKLGIDPTSPHLHLGRSVPLLKLRDFQNLGHQIVFIIGDATGVVGDTSDKDAERPMLTDSQVRGNLRTYVAQVSKILDKNLLEVRRNSEWLLKLNYRDIGEHADRFSVSDLLRAKISKNVWTKAGAYPFAKFCTPLCRGMTASRYAPTWSWAARTSGSSSRRARATGKTRASPAAYCYDGADLGTDGRKMSSSWGNTVNLSDNPQNMFGKVMSIPDELVETYFTHATRVSSGDIEKSLALHPKEAKMALAEEITRMYHGSETARRARKDFDTAFSKGGVPENIPEVLGRGKLRETLVGGGVVKSNSEFARLLTEGAIYKLDSEAGEIKIIDANAPALPGEVFRIGKHRFVKIAKK